MQVELTDEQLKAMYAILNRSSISGNDAEMVVSLKQALAKAAQPSQDTEKQAKKRGATTPKK